jgi:RNA methyltransferase, TrmH family
VRELRTLLRDAGARRDHGRFVVEGARLVASALDHGGLLEAVFVGVDAVPSALDVAASARARGVAVEQLASGVAERVGATVGSQGIFGVARRPSSTRGVPAASTFVVIVDRANDPGNVGTLWRSAAAAGADLFVLGRGSVDAYNPKLVRATAGACFSVPVLDDADITEVLEDCGTHGLVRAGAVVRGGTPVDELDLRAPCALVLGHEARGLDAHLPLDVHVTIPMHERTESLNLAMAGSVLCFEVARQRRASGAR